MAKVQAGSDARHPQRPRLSRFLSRRDQCCTGRPFLLIVVIEARRANQSSTAFTERILPVGRSHVLHTERVTVWRIAPSRRA